MGDLFKTKTPKPVELPEADYYNFSDALTGASTSRVKNADGSYTLVNNISDDTKQKLAQLGELQRQATQRYNNLADNYDISQIPGLSDAVTAAKQSLQATTDAAFRTSTKAQEQALAQYGIRGGTAAAEARGMLGGQYLQQTAENNRQGYQLEQNVRQNEMNNAMNKYQLANSQQQQITNDNRNAFQQGAQQTQYLTNLSQQRNIYNANQQAAYNQAKADASNSMMSTIGSLAGTAAGYALGGPIGGAIGGQLGGSAFGSQSSAIQSPSFFSSSSPMSSSLSSKYGITWS